MTTGTDRLKLNPPLGRMPLLQFCSPNELHIDPAYQRDVGSGAAQALIRRLAQHWNWDLCQPLVVARRRDLTERLFVIDGQHRLEAARLRGDIPQLPCVVVEYANTADEAASFVNLNQQRRQLLPIDVFKAAVASGDKEANAIAAALAEAGLSLAPHCNHISWKPAMTFNLPGIQQAWRRCGGKVTRLALTALAQGFGGQVLRYAGTLFPGLVAVCSDETDGGVHTFAADRFERFVAMLRQRSQVDWRQEILQATADDPDLSRQAAAPQVLRAAWAKSADKPVPERPRQVVVRPTAPVRVARRAPPAGPIWCTQCEQRVSATSAASCASPFCKAREAAA
jgi:hypothetical protein